MALELGGVQDTTMGQLGKCSVRDSWALTIIHPSISHLHARANQTHDSNTQRRIEFHFQTLVSYQLSEVTIISNYKTGANTQI